MSRRRWTADEVSGNRAALTGEHADHLSRVLRARVGQEFEIATVEGAVRLGRVTRVDPHRVEFELGDEIAPTATTNVTLALSIFKFDRMEWAIEKCTELGATRIVPVIASRTEAHLAAAAPKRVERWQRIALQASEQSRRNSPPQINQPLKLTAALALPGSICIVLDESEQQTMFRDVLHAHSVREVVLAFGPEGGWTQSELEQFRDAGWISASLGNTILRVETAAVAALAVTLSELA
jgi:16S rRNA (uracil1498-N3)-methyltransferase